MTRGRNRAATGQGRAQRDPVRRGGRKEGEAPPVSAKAPPSPRKTKPAAPAERPVREGAASRPRAVRGAPDLPRETNGKPTGRGGRPPGRAAPVSRDVGAPDAAKTRRAASKAAPPSDQRPPARGKGPPRYIAFHKPYGVLSQFTAESGHRALAEFNLPPEVYAAGRLDMDSEGLLLLSNDGRFINRLLSPAQRHERTYLVQVEGEPDEAALQRLREGVAIRDYVTRPARVERLAEDPALPPRDPPIRARRHIPTTWLRITLTEGRNRQVRRMTAAVGHPTLRLVRVRIGDLDLGDLPQGCWREVRPKDVLPGG